MNWDALGAIAETLGAIGVIATLAYLAAQIRQNTGALKGDAIREINNTEIALGKEAREDPELYAIVMRGIFAWDSQPPRDQARAHMYIHSYTRWFETCWTLWQRGSLDERTLRSRENSIFGILSNPKGGRVWWEEWKSVFDSAFVDYVERRLEELGGEAPNLADISFYKPEYWTETQSSSTGELADDAGAT